MSKQQRQFRELADKIWRELYIAGAALNNLETIAKSMSEPRAAEVLAAYKGLFEPATWGFIDTFIIAIENVTGRHPRTPSLRNAFAVLEENPSLTEGLNLEGLRESFEELDPEKKVIQWRQNWTAHRDLKANLPPFKVGELRPIYDILVQLFHDTCTVPASHLYNLEIKGAEHLDQVIKKLRDEHKGT